MKQDETQLNPLGLAEPVLVVGMGVTGLSVARYLARHAVPFHIVDSRDIPPGIDELTTFLSAEQIVTGEFNQSLIDAAATLIVSPGIAIRQPLFEKAAQNDADFIGDIELFFRVVKAPVIAVTGSNGKTTVTDLLGEMAKAAGVNVHVGGNIGTPVLDLVEDEATEMYVLELSSFQLETTHSLNAVVTTILNVSEDHMDRYAGLDDYTAAKARIFQGEGAVVVNLDDDRVVEVVNGLTDRQVIGFSLNETNLNETGDALYRLCYVNGQGWLCRANEQLLPIDELKIKGLHNVANALAALAMGEVAGWSMQAMLDTLKAYGGLPHRMQWLAEKDGVQWFNDSKATNVGATLAAIAGAPTEQVVLVAGGQGKGQDFTPLTDVLAERAAAVVLIGEDADVIEAIIPDSVPVYRVADMQAAVGKAKEIAKAGMAVLLSPACASFDMFSGYVQRGEAFITEVKEQLQ